MNAEKIKLAARLSAGSYKRALALLDEDLSERQQQALEFFRKTIQSSFLQTVFVIFIFFFLFSFSFLSFSFF